MIYKLDEITKKDVQEVGGKAANLSNLVLMYLKDLFVQQKRIKTIYIICIIN